MTCVLDRYDGHWKPMYLQCMPCHIQYRVIARLETLAADSAYILKAVGGRASGGSHVVSRGAHQTTTVPYYSGE